MPEQMVPDYSALSVVVVDDDARIVSSIIQFLRPLKCPVTGFTDSPACLAHLRDKPADIVITDLRMPKVDGFALIQKVKEWYPTANILVISGQADTESVNIAMDMGAFDFFEKPVNQTELLDTIRRTVKYHTAVEERNTLAEQLSYVARRESERWGIDRLVGRSQAMKQIVRSIGLLQGKANISVLITGESGTGKEMVARAIHFSSMRAERPFVPVNCSALPVDLAESAFFGHIRGAFTGATADRKGAFELAHEGTLFLDEIGDMAPIVQTKLLRVLEDGIVVPVGKTTGRTVDVRVIAATNCDLKQKIAGNSFRTDLYYRLAGYTIEIPPLRDHKEDIPALARHFVEMFSQEMGIMPPFLPPEILSSLRSYDYPGNVRELKNTIERMLIETGGKNITAGSLCYLNAKPSGRSNIQLPVLEVPGATAVSEVPSLKDAEKMLIHKAMTQTGGNVSIAARILGISRNKLYRKLRE